MDKEYIIDLKKNKENNDFVLDVSSINNLKALDLDINSCLVNYKKALDREDLEKAKEILEVLNSLTQYGDKRFSNAKIFFRAKEIILLYKNMDTENIIDSMNILLKIKSLFRFLNSQITFEYNDENSILIEEIQRIRNTIKVTKLIDNGLYKNYNPSMKDLDIVSEFKESFADNEEYNHIEDIYNLFEKKISNEIKNLNMVIYLEGIEKCKNIFKGKYDDSFYNSKEFRNLLSKNNIGDYREFNRLLDKYYLIYQYNNEANYKEKRTILMKVLLDNFINIPKIYRSFIVENIIENKKTYIEIDNFYDDINKNLKGINEEERLNAIVI